MSIEHIVAQHYAHGSLEAAILKALEAAGKDQNQLSLKDLSPVDEFHIGGRLATVEFAKQLKLQPGMQVLDIGCGLGGASRYIAQEYQCAVAGIDLSDEYVQVANMLAERVKLDAKVRYQQGSALDLPFADASFDVAYMCHVGMNIEDKPRLFKEVRRVLRPAGVFGIYDAMLSVPGDLSYPVPWASSPAASFVVDAATYRRLLGAAGFEVLQERDRRAFALETFEQMRAKAASGPSPLGLHIVMGANAAAKVRNMMANVTASLIIPTELICRVV
jgi:ubiquinone/menaquinone biosynthesis C-methylase UbiE